MRDRPELEGAIWDVPLFVENGEKAIIYNQHVIINVLLDIRDLLTKEKNER